MYKKFAVGDHPTGRYKRLIGNVYLGGLCVDCACGAGRGVMSVAHLFDTVIGIDIDRSAVDHAIMNGLPVIRADICNIPLCNAVVDHFICSDTLEHIEKEQNEAAFMSIARVLKSNGTLFITVPALKNSMENPFHLQYFPPAKIVDIALHFLGQSHVFVDRYMDTTLVRLRRGR